MSTDGPSIPSISFALVPLLLAQFQSVPLLSPLANLIAIPLVSFVVTPLVLLAIPWPTPLLLVPADFAAGWMMAFLAPSGAVAGYRGCGPDGRVWDGRGRCIRLASWSASRSGVEGIIPHGGASYNSWCRPARERLPGDGCRSSLRKGASKIVGPFQTLGRYQRQPGSLLDNIVWRYPAPMI